MQVINEHDKKLLKKDVIEKPAEDSKIWSEADNVAFNELLLRYKKQFFTEERSKNLDQFHADSIILESTEFVR